MPTKQKRTTRRPPPTQRRATAAQERGDIDYRSSCAPDNVPRKPVAGRSREAAATTHLQSVRMRGVADGRETGIAPDDAKVIQLASLRARRRGLH